MSPLIISGKKNFNVVLTSQNYFLSMKQLEISIYVCTLYRLNIFFLLLLHTITIISLGAKLFVYNVRFYSVRYSASQRSNCLMFQLIYVQVTVFTPVALWSCGQQLSLTQSEGASDIDRRK